MAIRDVITRGFGNGTYDPGVNKLPTRGYSISSATIIGGPFTVDASDVYNAGSVAADSYNAGSEEFDFYNAGSVASEKAQ